MKRRHTRDPPKIRGSSVRGFNGVRSSDNRFDVISAKRMKFTDPEIDCPQDIRPNLSAVQHEATRAPSPGSNAPKTSEYAFFKKLKKDAGSSCSYPLHKEGNQLKNSESSGCAREFTNMFKDSCEDLRSSFLVEKARPFTRNFFLSPPVNASNSSEAANNVEKSHKGIRSPLFLDKVKPINHNLFLSPLGGALKHSGTGYMDEEVFSGKRKKLHQWVADTALPEVVEHYTKGCNLVSVLLNRLFPETDKSNHCRDVKPMEMKADTRYCSHAFPKSDKQFHWTQRRDLVEAEHERHVNDFCNRSRGRILSKWDTKDSDSPSSSYAADIHFQHENKKCGAGFDGGTASWITLRDPYLCSNFENYRSIASSPIKELDEFQDLDASAIGGEPCSLLLDWNFRSAKDGGDLSIATHNPEMNLHSLLATSWDDHQQSLDNRFNAGELYSSSFFSANLHNREVGRDLEDENKFLVSELKHFPLTLSSTPRYLNLREEFCTDDTFLSSQNQNHHWIISKVFSEPHHPGLEALLPSGPDFNLGWKCLSMSGSCGEHSSSYDHGFQSLLKEGPCSYLLTEEDCLYGSTRRQAIAHFAEATLNSHDWFSTKNLQMPLDRETASPLLLDSSSWLRSDEDVYNDDDEQIYI